MQMQLMLTEKVDFGKPIVVTAHSKETYVIQNVTSPTLDEVCSMMLETNITQCAVPRLHAVFEQERNVVRLQLEKADFKHKEHFLQMQWNAVYGEVLTWPKGKNEMVISSNLVAPCLCFQVWSEGEEKSRRGNYCPFMNQQDILERMLHNVTLSMMVSQMSDGNTGLSWNVTSPCKLKAEVWLCKKDLTESRCEEVMGSRQKLKPVWSTTRSRHWQMGEFDVPHHPHLCVQMMLEGTQLFLEPHCPFTASRARWILPLLIGLLLMCLAILGAYITQGVLKGYVWRWLKEDDVKGAVGGGHVVLLYSPDDDNQRLPELLCHLGSCLQALGFTVSLDLWSQAELSILGPVPWLHSRLDRLQRQGGKVVLVLTQATWTRAEEWGAFICGRNTPGERDTAVGEGESKRSHPASSRRVDVFGASLNCVLADCIQGRAGERFMLVQFESLPPEPPGSFRPLPQLFRGLHVYSLPSQSLGFLTELAGARQMASASARRKRAGGLRMASRTLARKLSGFTAGTNVLRLAEVSQGCIGVGVDNSVETIPLNPCLLTPLGTPDSNTKTSETGWI
ncbi:interleukin-17 receptor C [Xenentodon cancila]